MYKKLISEWNKNKLISMEAYFGILDAVKEVYPLIVLANLSKNEYVLLKNTGFLHTDISEFGKYDDIIDIGINDIHPNYQSVFVDCFDRKKLIKTYNEGRNEVYAELYQKEYCKDSYHWISLNAVRLKDDSGDMIHICFIRELPKNGRWEFIRK